MFNDYLTMEFSNNAAYTEIKNKCGIHDGIHEIQSVITSN